MATLLLIDTSTTACSVALTDDGQVLLHPHTLQPQQHATVLSGFIKECLDHARDHEMTINAVGVTLGPGSYTGLRIGLSEAKGLAYALGVPLIGVSTLEVLAVTAMFSNDFTGEELLIPMIDARRMEVYTAVYSPALEAIEQPHPLILTPGCLNDLVLEHGGKAIAIGDGASKSVEAWGQAAAGVIIQGNEVPLAANMLALAERAWHRGDFLDLAYSVPEYLKEFRALKPKRPF